MFSCPWPNCWPPCSAQPELSLQVANLLDSNHILTWFPLFSIVPFSSSINKHSARVQLQRPVFVGHAGLSFIGFDLRCILSCFFCNHRLHAFWLLDQSTALTLHWGLHKSGWLFLRRRSKGSSNLCLYKPRVIMQIRKVLEKQWGSLEPSPFIPHSWLGPSLLCKKKKEKEPWLSYMVELSSNVLP